MTCFGRKGERLEKGALEDAFEMRWGALQNELAEVERGDKGKPAVPKRSMENMVEEILELVRTMQRGTPEPLGMEEERRRVDDLTRALKIHIQALRSSIADGVPPNSSTGDAVLEATKRLTKSLFPNPDDKRV